MKGRGARNRVHDLLERMGAGRLTEIGEGKTVAAMFTFYTIVMAGGFSSKLSDRWMKSLI